MERLKQLGLAVLVLLAVSACGKKDGTMTKEELMRKAIEFSEENVASGGGSFGVVITRNSKIIATGVNRVTANNDPTAHAEVSAIRAACKKLNTFDLSGCKIFTSCEPCPCASVPSTGHTSTKSISVTTRTMPRL